MPSQYNVKLSQYYDYKELKKKNYDCKNNKEFMMQ